jgi:uncharacterized pyridoxamine 5'-phosphate oxidase family protein
MNEVLRILEKNRSGYFATVDNDKPEIRPFEFQFDEDGRLCFCTNESYNDGDSPSFIFYYLNIVG